MSTLNFDNSIDGLSNRVRKQALTKVFLPSFGKFSFMLKHRNPATGFIEPCSSLSTCDIRKSEHQFTKQQPEVPTRDDLARTVPKNWDHLLSDNYLYLLFEAVRKGFRPHYDTDEVASHAQYELWSHSMTLAALQKMLNYSSVHALPQEHQVVAQQLVSNPGVSPEQLSIPRSTIIDVCSATWCAPHSPLNRLAYELVQMDSRTVTGYTPGSRRSRIEIMHTEHVLSQFRVHSEDLMKNVWAYDIETDTTHNLGLRPHQAQITEIVISNHEKSIILSGDEKYILEEFAKTLNKAPVGTILAGWNNYSFDNVFMQVRASFHQTPNWNGVLSRVYSKSPYCTASLDGGSYALEWTPLSTQTPMRNVDLFRERLNITTGPMSQYSRSLKGFVKHFGCEPIQVDRTAMHHLNDKEREAYVASDGVMTLRAYSELCSKLV